MECYICKKSSQETELFEGIYENQIIKVCKKCADLELIPLLKKPTEEQLLVAEHRGSVRERLEKLSGKIKPISKDHEIAKKNLGKLKIPEKKQYDEKLIENYDWALRTARRRKKLSIEQLSQQTGLPAELLDSLEKGQLPDNFETEMRQLELILNVKLLKQPKQEIHFKKPTQDKEKEILHDVEEKMHQTQEKNEKIKQIQSGELDFSKRENIENITLADLQKLKEERDKKAAFELEKKQHKEMVGEEIILDDDID